MGSGDWLPKPGTNQFPDKGFSLRELWSAGMETCYVRRFQGAFAIVCRGGIW